MIGTKKVLAIIPARGGSKGLPRKNILPVAGKPLIAWTIEAAKRSQYIDQVILSSEDREIIDVAKEWGCEVPFIRPEALAQDGTPGIDPVIHAVKTLPKDFDYVVLLQPTSPLRTTADIDGTIELCVNKSAKSCVSVTESPKSPYWMYSLDDKDQLRPLMGKGWTDKRRQDLPRTYVLNGAVYVVEIDWMMENKALIGTGTVAYLMPEDRSLDIDKKLDLQIAEYILSSKTE